MSAVAENPYPGLRPFEAEQAHLFFGREEQCDQLLSRLGRHRFVAVVGSSGSGKSSLVRAGLLPGLYGGLLAGGLASWRIAVLRPGEDPLGRLAAALDEALGEPEVRAEGESGEAAGLRAADFTGITLRRGPLGLIEAAQLGGLGAGESLLVVVDQFEELFRFARTAPEDAGGAVRDDRAAFVRLLLEAAAQTALPIYVVLTLRSDYIGEASRYPELAAAISESQFLVPRLSRGQLKAAIEGPAAVGGAGVAPRLVQRLLADVGEDSDQLPLLQHALMRTWERWVAAGRRGPLDLAHYEGAGGTREALSRHADEAFEELDEEGRRIAEALFRSLTEKNDEQRGVRRPSELAEIAAVAAVTAAAVARVAEVFRRPGRSFLMPPAEVPLIESTVLDLSHESLMRVWQRLRGWVDAEGAAAARWRRLAENARLYQAGEAGLLRQPELGAAEAFCQRERPTAAWAARHGGDFAATAEFVAASRRSHRRRETLKALVLPALVALLFGAVAWRERVKSEATIEAQREEIARLEGERQELRQQVAAAGSGQQQRRAEIERLRGGNLGLRGQAEQQQTANAALVAEIARLESLKSRLTARAAVLREEDKNLAAAIARLTERGPRLAGLIASAKARRGCLSGRLERSRAAEERLRARAEGLGIGTSFETASMSLDPRDGNPWSSTPPWPDPEAPEQVTRAAELRRELEELETRLREIAGQAPEEEREIARLREEEQLLSSLLAELEREAATSREEIARLSAETAKLEQEIVGLEKTVALRRQEKSRLENALAAGEKELEDLDAENERLGKELRRLESQSFYLRRAIGSQLEEDEPEQADEPPCP